ncbi:MAG: glycosyltransferase [Bacteriovoracaceae bacterium]|nr:glycosyltransferase [Bacteriovoracaceae bacterium]
MSKIKISVICSTYNQPHFLEMVLDSLFYQKNSSFELIVADDGSGVETRELISDLKERAPFPVKHLWHEDNGWQKSQIHNRAIRETEGDLLIFIDGDCILHPHFVDDHYQIFKKHKSNYVMMGRRVELGEAITEGLTPSNYRSWLLSLFPIKLFLSDSISSMRRYSFSSKIMRTIFKADKVRDLLGCNFSLSKESMYQINGFNEAYERGEDGDIFVRLRNSGHNCLGMKYYAPMFHLYHGRGNYQYVDDNYHRIFKLTDYIRCDKGLC